MIEGTEKGLKEHCQQLTMAYARVFEKNSPFVQDVLEDLARFCRANESTFHPDPRVHAELEGRREVFLRIQQLIDLNYEQVFQYHVALAQQKRRSNPK